MSYFAAAVTRTEDGWAGSEVDLSEVEDLDGLAEALRDLADEAADTDPTAVLLLEEDDEYFAVVRVKGDGSLEEPRVFLSDVRAVQASDVAAMLWEAAATVDEPEDDDEDADPDDDDDDEDEGTRAVSEPVGDSGLLHDLGTPAADLLALCAGEGLLPADALVAIAERAGFAEVLDRLRPV